MRDYRHFLFFTRQIGTDKVVLDQEETRHAVNVLRLSEGERFLATDGRGNTYRCIHGGIHNHQLEGIIEEKRFKGRTLPLIHLFIGMPERDSLETALVDCTALGAASITPLICEFSQKQWWKNAWQKQFQRFQNKMISSVKQSLSSWIPELNQPTAFAHLNSLSGIVITADPDGRSIYSNREKIINADTISLLIGPPGGFSPTEEKILEDPGILHVKIAASRLRTELAASALLAQVSGLFTD